MPTFVLEDQDLKGNTNLKLSGVFFMIPDDSNMKTPNEAKELIRRLILAQQELFFTGGIAENSEFYKNFQKDIKRISLETYGI